MRKYLIVLLSSLTLFFAQLVMASDGASVTLLKQVTGDMISALNAQKAAIAKDPNTIVNIVDQIIVPHIDFTIMSKSVLARNWETATPQQRQQFQDVFSRWAVLTYSAAFLNYTNQTIEFGKVRPIGNRGDREEVFSFIVQSNGQKIPVNYRMVKTAQGWKAYDINVENVSLVTSFRTQINNEIKNKGLDTVIADLAERNKKGLIKSK